MLRSGFRLVQALQGAVMTFVQAPAAANGNPHEVELVERNPERTNRSLQQRRIGDIESQSLGLQQPSSVSRFLPAFVRKVDVGPTGEPVFLVPGGLPMAEEHKCRHPSCPSSLLQLFDGGPSR